MGDVAQSALQIAGTVLLNLGLALMVGGLAWASIHGSAPTSATSAAGRIAAIVGAGASVSLVGSMLVLWSETALMAEVPVLEAGGQLWHVVRDSRYGHAWGLGAAALIVGVAASIGKGRPAGGTRLGIAFAAVLTVAASRSAVSHSAMASGVLPVAVDGVHLLLVSLWSGEVFLAAFMTLPSSAPRDIGAGHACAEAVETLSSVATGALAGVVVTGAFNSWRGLNGTPGALLNSAYGTVLLIKLALVAAAVALGGFNRFIVMPPLTRSLRASQETASPHLRRFVRVLRIESLVLLAVMIAAAFLAASPPVAGA